ncbi:MAG: tetratricopeptide repeat protein [Methanomassiliicoccales archaeon]
MPRIHLSQRERLLLHLMEMDRYRDEIEIPIWASQEGIARRLRTQVHNVSRALAPLIDEGLVMEKLAHFKGAKKRRKAYFLTAKGRDTANSIAKDLQQMRISFESGEERREATLEEVMQIVSRGGKAIGLFDLLDAACRCDVLSESFLLTTIGRKDNLMPSISHGRPRVEVLYGRGREKEELLTLLNVERVKTILITGLPGIGKSALASQIFEENIGNAPQLWHTIHEWESEDRLIQELREILVASGALGLAMRSKEGLSIKESYPELVKDLSLSRLILFLDDAQKARGSMLLLMNFILEAVRAAEGAKLILISKVIPDWYPVGRPDCARIDLVGLDDNAARQMALSKKAENVEAIIKQSKGHPLLISILSSSGESKGVGEAIAFLDQEMTSSLNEDELEAMEAISVHRRPLPLAALSQKQRVALQGLRKKGFLIENEEGVYSHDLLLSHFRTHISGERSKELHAAAARFYLSGEDAEKRLEGLYHAVKAKDIDLVRKVICGEGERLAYMFPEEMEAILQTLRGWEGMTDLQFEMLMCLALALEELGREEQALSVYDEALLNVSLSDIRKAKALERKARIQMDLRRWTQSLEAHERALGLYRSLGDRAGEARELMSLGAAYRRKGDLEEARDLFEKAREIAEEIQDGHVLSAALNNLAMVEWDRGSPSRAEPLFRDSIAAAHQAEDMAGEGQALRNLAALLRAQGRAEEAWRRLEESESAFLRIGMMEDSWQAAVERAKLLAELDREGEGIDLLRRLLLERMRRTPWGKRSAALRFECQVRWALVKMLREGERLREAEDEALELEALAEKRGDVQMACKARIERAMILEEEGHVLKAMDALETVRRKLLPIGDAHGMAVVHFRLGLLARKARQCERALMEMREALHYATVSGDVIAMASIYEELGLMTGDAEERASMLRQAYESYLKVGRKADAERIFSLLNQ